MKKRLDIGLGVPDWLTILEIEISEQKHPILSDPSSPCLLKANCQPHSLVLTKAMSKLLKQLEIPNWFKELWHIRGRDEFGRQ